MSEFVPRPVRGRRYGHDRRVRVSDAGPEGVLRRDGLARYLQDVATDDWADAGLSPDEIWVVRRTAVRVAEGGRWPALGENVTLTTWFGGTGPAWAERRTDLEVDGRELPGTHFAMDYLYARNRWAATELGPATSVAPPAVNPISAAGKQVVVIGGGDTGADCIGQAMREGARSVLQLELVPEPPPNRLDDRTPWPLWPNKLRLSYAMREAQAAGRGELDFSVVTTRISG